MSKLLDTSVRMTMNAVFDADIGGVALAGALAVAVICKSFNMF